MIFQIVIVQTDDFYDVDDETDYNYGDSDNFDCGNRDDSSNYNMIIWIYRFKTIKIMRGFIVY